MSYKIKIIIAGLFMALMGVFAYVSLRMDLFEQQMTANLKKQNEFIIKKHQAVFNEQEIKKISHQDLKAFLDDINRTLPNMALAVISDNDRTIRLTSKNDRIITTSALYDAILHDFTGDRLKTIIPGDYLVRYYESGSAEKSKRLKYYIFNNNVGTGAILAVFPHSPGKVIITRAALEIALMVLIIVIVCSMLIIIHGQKQRIINFAENAPKTGKKKALRHSARHDDSSAVRENLVMASEGLGAYVYGLFSDIRAQTRCRSLSLYVISGENSMTRLFEYRDNSFIKTDSPHFDVIDLNSGLGRELSLGTTVILMEGKKAVLPLAARGRLMGTIHVLSDYSLEGSDIDAITTMTEPLLKKLADYLTLNTVMVNQDTGLFSETYFMMKYNETAGRSSARKKPFSLILLSLARDMKQLTEEQRKGVLKIITALLDEEITDDHFLCHYGTFIAVFLPESSEKVTRVTAEKIFKTLTRVRIALPSQDHLDLNPFMGWASSDMLTDPRGVLGQAHKNADRALVKDEANIQETPITV